jgi:hypothetical protein
MEFLFFIGRAKDNDIFRKIRINGYRYLLGRNDERGFVVGRLVSRVDSGIRAAGAVDTDIFSVNFPEDPLYFSLDSGGVRLKLPALIISSVVR